MGRRSVSVGFRRGEITSSEPPEGHALPVTPVEISHRLMLRIPPTLLHLARDYSDPPKHSRRGCGVTNGNVVPGNLDI
jgi:hypothetical protein